MKKITLTAGLILSLSTTAFAADVTIPNTFTAGSPAVAADVNANFSAVKTAVDDNNARVTTNSTNITNATNGISANTSSAATNASGIASNAANISTNSSTAVINAAGVASNASNISTQGSSIATNAANISSNTSSASTNASNITSNTGNISTNASNISSNSGSIAANTNSASSNSSGIATNTSNIATNTAAIAAIPSATVYDYRDYLTTASSKTFSVASNTYCADSETRSFVRTPNGSDTDVEVTHRGYTGVTPCDHRVFHSTNTPTERLLKSKDVYTVGGINDGLLNHTSRLDDPITVRTSTMNKGQSFTDASTTYKQPAGGVDALDGIHIQTTYASGLEDITVAAGSYTNCLKVYVTRNSQGFGGSTDSRVSWHCPNNVGMVKRIRYRLGTEYRVYELQSINF